MTSFLPPFLYKQHDTTFDQGMLSCPTLCHRQYPYIDVMYDAQLINQAYRTWYFNLVIGTVNQEMVLLVLTFDVNVESCSKYSIISIIPLSGLSVMQYCHVYSG